MGALLMVKGPNHGRHISIYVQHNKITKLKQFSDLRDENIREWIVCFQNKDILQRRDLQSTYF